MLRSKVNIRPWPLIAAIPVAVALVYVVYSGRSKPYYNLSEIVSEFDQQAAASEYAVAYKDLTASELNQKLNALAEQDLRPLNPNSRSVYTLSFTSPAEWQIVPQKTSPPLLLRAVPKNLSFSGLKRFIYREEEYSVLQTSVGSVVVLERTRYWLIVASPSAPYEMLPATLKTLN